MGVSGIHWWVRVWLLKVGSNPMLGSPLLPPVFTLPHDRSFFLTLVLAISQEISPVVLWPWGLSQLLRQGLPELKVLLCTTFLMVGFWLFPLGITDTYLI